MKTRTKKILKYSIAISVIIAVLAAGFILFPVVVLSCNHRPKDMDPHGMINGKFDMSVPVEWKAVYVNDGYPAVNCGCMKVPFPPYYAVFDSNDRDDAFLAAFQEDKDEYFENSFSDMMKRLCENGSSVPSAFVPDFSVEYLWRQFGENEKQLLAVYIPVNGLLHVIGVGL